MFQQIHEGVVRIICSRKELGDGDGGKCCDMECGGVMRKFRDVEKVLLELEDGDGLWGA